MRILNKVRNNLSHNLIVDLRGEESRIINLQIPPLIQSDNSLPILEHLLYGTLTYINILAEYLHKDVLNEELRWILNIRAPQFGVTETNFPIISVVQRISHATI